MADKIMVTKRDGRLEELNLDKIHRVLEWAAEGLNGVSVSQVELKTQIQFIDGMHTTDIHKTLIKSAADLISESVPDYSKMAARLTVFHLRKVAYGDFPVPELYKHVQNLVSKGLYDKELLERYTKEEYDIIEKFIVHDRDMNFEYAGIKQLEGKYLVQDRVTKKVFESPQVAYILIAMCLFQEYDKKYSKEKRLEYIQKYYNAASLFKISLPTPIMGGVRTPTRQFSSCVLIEAEDSLDSISAVSTAIVKYTSKRAGIGINGGRLRGLGSSIRNGEGKHPGCIPFFKLWQSAVKSCCLTPETYVEILDENE